MRMGKSTTVLIASQFFAVGSCAHAQEVDSGKLNSEGIALYRIKQYSEAADKFRAAIKTAEPGSRDELTALLSNLRQTFTKKVEFMLNFSGNS